jgi:hypothetical protein
MLRSHWHGAYCTDTPAVRIPAQAAPAIPVFRANFHEKSIAAAAPAPWRRDSHARAPQAWNLHIAPVHSNHNGD